MDNITDKKERSSASLNIILISLAAALVFSAVESAAHFMGLELRTFAQVIKGTCLWLVVPCTVLFAANDLLLPHIQENGRVMNWMRRIALVVFLLVILIVAFFRCLFYGLTDEMVTETIMPDGYIQGQWSNFLSETHYDYYEPVALFFRKPFQGWRDEELLHKVREKYGENAEFVERQENGYCVFRIPDALDEGNYIYFHVNNSYNITSNALFQILLSEACHFWEGENRTVALSGDGSVSLEDKKDTGQEIESLSSLDGSFYITCTPSELDISACAADLADWLQFVKETGQYPLDLDSDSPNLPGMFNIGYITADTAHFFPFYLTPLSDYMDAESWSVRYDQIRYHLSETYRSSAAYWKTPPEMIRQEEADATAKEDADALFMKSYDGNFEQEYKIEGTTISYRMVVRDAALGNRLYSLLKSTDGGETWQMLSSDPFEQNLGAGIDFSFSDENTGYAKLIHHSEIKPDYYKTEDGGKTWELYTPDETKQDS